MIKLSKLLFFCSALFLITACGNDDDAAPVNSDLEGTWEAVSFEFVAETSSEFAGTTTDVLTQLEGSNMNYELTFTSDAFTTSGSYDIELQTSLDGSPQQTQSQSYTNVDGSGTYSADGSVMTINGSFFNLTVNGVSYSGANGAQMADYEINAAGNLVFTQDQTVTDNSGGANTTSKQTSSSVWRKK